ncbi:MAG: hypothetical protein JWL76_1975 [Thermoleophilia bacterium]|nr:hypothetical protein [Thermoleophilia bacterium]
MPRPLLLLDVDGVLSPTTAGIPPGYERIETDKYRVTLGKQHAEWLRELGDLYELAWATSWGAAANAVYAPLLGLADLPVVPLPNPTSTPSWKLPHVSEWVSGRSVAWVDDELFDADFAWAKERDEPTLLLRTRASVGLTEAEVIALRVFELDLRESS